MSKKHASEVQNIFCTISQIKGHRIHQQGNLAFYEKCILNLRSMLNQPALVLMKVFSVFSKILSTCCGKKKIYLTVFRKKNHKVIMLSFEFTSNQQVFQAALELALSPLDISFLLCCCCCCPPFIELQLQILSKSYAS